MLVYQSVISKKPQNEELRSSFFSNKQGEFEAMMGFGGMN